MIVSSCDRCRAIVIASSFSRQNVVTTRVTVRGNDEAIAADDEMVNRKRLVCKSDLTRESSNEVCDDAFLGDGHDRAAHRQKLTVRMFDRTHTHTHNQTTWFPSNGRWRSGSSQTSDTSAHYVTSPPSYAHRSPAPFPPSWYNRRSLGLAASPWSSFMHASLCGPFLLLDVVSDSLLPYQAMRNFGLWLLHQLFASFLFLDIF